MTDTVSNSEMKKQELAEIDLFKISDSSNTPRLETLELLSLVWEVTTRIFCLRAGLSFEGAFRPVNLSFSGKETGTGIRWWWGGGGHCYFGPLEGS